LLPIVKLTLQDRIFGLYGGFAAKGAENLSGEASLSCGLPVAAQWCRKAALE